MKTDDINRLIDQRQSLAQDVTGDVTGEVKNSAHEAEDVHRNVDAVNMSEERVHKSDKSIHKPTAWMLHGELFWPSEYEVISEAGDNAIPLYTAPSKREWVWLTEDEMQETGRYSYCRGGTSEKLYHIMWNSKPSASVGWCRDELIAFARAIEAKLKEKNT